MKIYLTPNNTLEDLINTFEELDPDLVTSRMVIEVTTADKNLAALLEKLSDKTPDTVNAAPTPKKPRQTKKGKAISLTPSTIEQVTGTIGMNLNSD